MAEIICIVLLIVIGMYSSYRYGFSKALQEYNEYLLELHKRENNP